jgi:hypothetical protein
VAELRLSVWPSRSASNAWVNGFGQRHPRPQGNERQEGARQRAKSAFAPTSAGSCVRRPYSMPVVELIERGARARLAIQSQCYSGIGSRALRPDPPARSSAAVSGGGSANSGKERRRLQKIRHHQRQSCAPPPRACRPSAAFRSMWACGSPTQPAQ